MAGAGPRLTVVVSPREAHRFAEASLRSILADDAEPYDLVYLDILSPPETSAAIDALAKRGGGRVVRHNGWIAPAAARKIALRDVSTPYIAFIDNDVFVDPGCFAAMVACAEETGAGLVGPLYLQGDAGAWHVHMAGGHVVRNSAGAIVAENYALGARPEAEASGLTRGPTGFVEWHCLLMRTELARQGDVLSDDILMTREHLHVSMAAAERGASVWLEPDARVRFGLYTAPTVADLPFFRRRWDLAACEASITAFCRRWPVANVEHFMTGIRSFVATKRGQSQALAELPGLEPEAAMAPAELAQSRTALCEQAAARGYGAADVNALEQACDYATLLSDGLYRGDGRPFLNHLIGTASVLVRYGFRRDLVVAGLLHAGYSHRPPWIDPEEVALVLGAQGDADAVVRDRIAARQALASGAAAGALPFLTACGLAIDAAAAAERQLSGEARARGAAPRFDEAGLGRVAEVLGALGAGGLAVTLASDGVAQTRGSVLGRPVGGGSFRLDARARRWGPAARPPEAQAAE